MTELIEDLLKLSRIGKVTDTLTEVDVVQLVQSIAERLSTRLDQARATLNIDGNMPSVLADRMRLFELFENLVINAIKYGCDKPSTTIRIGSVETGGEVRFYVKDNGPGIAPEYHEKIFGMFQRLDSEQEGTGVGLAIVSRIAQAHGARVWVESEVGEGATFWIGWPLPKTD